jgi:hypothetical protein
MHRNISCVTCDVEMIYPACEGFNANMFKPSLCSVCSHSAHYHSKEAIAELMASYAKDVRLDYAEVPSRQTVIAGKERAVLCDARLCECALCFVGCSLDALLTSCVVRRSRSLTA